MMKHYIRTVFLLLMFACATLSVAQKRVVAVHEVKKGETLYSLSKQYGVTLEDLTAVNPDISKNPDKKLKSGYLINIPQNENDKTEVTTEDTFKLAVVLPFSAEGKEGKRSIEFYRGLLMAMDKERERGACVSVMAIEEPQVKEGVTNVTTTLSTCDGLDAVVGPLYPTHFQEISDFCKTHQLENVIPFSSKVKQVEANPYIYLLNTPQNIVEQNSFDLFESKFEDRRCVVIRTIDGAEAPLVNSWIEKMLMRQYEVQTLSASFTVQDLQQALSLTKSNVIIFDGSNQQESLNILQRINKFREVNGRYKFAVVGHNAWQQFSMEYNELLSTLDTYLLAGDFYNAYNHSVIEFEDNYYKWFKEYPMMLHPRMGELGYDTGLFVLNFHKYQSGADIQWNKVGYLQTKFNFTQVGSGGYANTTLMFVRYTPNNKVELIELKK